MGGQLSWPADPPAAQTKEVVVETKWWCDRTKYTIESVQCSRGNECTPNCGLNGKQT